jgi:hypothetical protein
MDLFVYPYLLKIKCFLSLSAVNYKECQNLWVLGSISKLVNLTIFAKKNLSHQNFQKLKIRERKMYLRGALDSTQFHCMGKVDYLALRCCKDT